MEKHGLFSSDTMLLSLTSMNKKTSFSKTLIATFNIHCFLDFKRLLAKFLLPFTIYSQSLQLLSLSVIGYSHNEAEMKHSWGRNIRGLYYLV